MHCSQSDVIRNRKSSYGLLRAFVLLSSAAPVAMGDGLRVTVGFVNLFNHSTAEHIPQLGEIYDLAHPRCSGDPAFVSRTGYAPENYCLHGVHPNDLTRVIGAEWWWAWKSRVVQEWANVLRPRYDSEYDAALHAQVKVQGMPLKYDQFALERVCLAKWQRVESKSALIGGRPWHTPEVVVVPSLMMHLQEQRWRGHLAWNLMLPKECMESNAHSKPLPAFCTSQGYGNIGVHRRYWGLVRKMHFAPYALRAARGGGVGGSSSSGRAGRKPPLIVVHHSFVWDTPTFALVLRTLLEQPKAFVDRVVVACLETNLKLPAAGLGLDGLLPLVARGPAAELRARRAVAAAAAATGNNSSHLFNVAATTGAAVDSLVVGAAGRPLLVALPYPTGLGLVSTPQFAPPKEHEMSSSGSNSQSVPQKLIAGTTPSVVNTGTYDPYRRRPITVLLDASLSRKGQGSGDQNWVREAVRDRLLEAGGTCHGDTCSLCHDHSGGEPSPASPIAHNANSAPVPVACGWPLAQESASTATLWEKLVTSSFCLEPAGDTPTRSHMYAAVLSGCVPVLLDGGLPDYPGNVETWWAWREHGLRYEDFAVVVNATAVQSRAASVDNASAEAGSDGSLSRSGGGDLMKELSRMPTDNPARFLALRRGVDRAAVLLRYAADNDESELAEPIHINSKSAKMNAFQHFELIVREAAAVL